MDYQNLQDDDQPRRYWSYGRIWLRRRGDWYEKRFGTLQIEWNVPCGHCGWSVTFGGGDSGRNLGFTFAIPFLLTIYVTIERVFPMYPFGTDFDRGHDREIGCYFFGGAFWYHIWVSRMASWSRDFPWCRWWRQGSFHFANLLGKRRYRCETLKAGIPVVIPMPEGLYYGTAKIERATWKRPLWFAMTRISTTIDCPKGIPFAGKGENSWDCGDDGLFGWGAEGNSVEKAIAHGVESVLISRRRYGHASPQAIADALSVAR